ncbi:hypothetical protein B0H67DRAFT_570708 [Lasiosphaeris hirsuta]|uniref:Uncharacterized protein n=1 Tax=Lasiosphaeris hirsuta TaxID=260670 RepID=A0AA40B0T5_9PEZI|nr:hypothetical protein B0H67DRAFT_570708 [Lasiosphaeris hirsuta]
MSNSQDPGWHEEVMRQKYNDPRKLKDFLDKTYGSGNYLVKIRSNRWILCLPEPLQEGELEDIERRIRVHYKPN